MDHTPPPRGTSAGSATPNASLFSPVVPRGGIRRGTTDSHAPTPGGNTEPTRVTRSPSPPPNRSGPLSDTIEQLTVSMRRSVCQTLASVNRGRLSSIVTPAVSAATSMNPPYGSWHDVHLNTNHPQPPQSTSAPPVTMMTSRPISVLSMVSPMAAVTTAAGGVGGPMNRRYGDPSDQLSLSPESHLPVPQLRPTGGSPYSVDADDSDGFLSPFGRVHVHSEPKTGKNLLINLLSTWGDAFEVGLCGIELYSDKGELLVPSNHSHAATSSSSSVSFRIVAETLHGTAPGAGGADPWAGSRSPSVGLGFGGSESNPNDTADAAGQWTSTAMLHVGGNDQPPTSLVRTTLFPDATQQQQQEEDNNVPSPLKRRHEVQNLVNGNHINTHDESEMYLTAFQEGHHHIFCLVFDEPVTIAVVRVFNYCGGGRSKTNKGVRWMEMTFDDELLFRGEVREASAAMVPVSLFTSSEDDSNDLPSPNGVSIRSNDDEQAAPSSRRLERAQQCFDAAGNCENILFTENDQILKDVMLRSWAYARERLTAKIPSLSVPPTLPSPPPNPPTSSRPAGESPARNSSGTRFSFPGRTTSLGKRANPLMLSFTSALTSSSMDRPGTAMYHNPVPQQPTSTGPLQPSAYPDLCPRGVTSLCLCFRSTWGDSAQVGLSALRLRSPTGEIIESSLIAHCYLEWPSGTHSRRRDSSCGNSPHNTAIMDSSINPVVPNEPVDEDLLPQYLFGGSTTADAPPPPPSACLWRFEPGMQLIVLFAQPVDLGWIDVVNYASGKRTHCGVRNVRLFVSTKLGGNVKAGERRCEYAYLWDEGVDVTPLRSRDVHELTPPDGIVLRKAPATPLSLGSTRYQSFDLSEAAQGASLSTSLGASMAVRATAAMRRARQSLLARPEWLNQFQPCVTPLLPVGYVFKVVLDIAARRAPTGMTVASSTAPLPTAAVALKNFVRPWITQPSAACTFLQDDGSAVDPSQLFCEGLLAFQETGGGSGTDGSSNSELLVTVTLMFVSDQAFVVSALLLHPPLVTESLTVSRDGATEALTSIWIRQVSIAADDVKIYDSSVMENPVTTPGSSSSGGPSPVVFFTLDERILSRYAQTSPSS